MPHDSVLHDSFRRLQQVCLPPQSNSGTFALVQGVAPEVVSISTQFSVEPFTVG
jgi:hypothetical protein